MSLSWLHNFGVQIAALVSVVLTVVTIPWIIMTKKETTSAVAWCLLVFFLPPVGFVAFVIFGYQHVNRHLKRKRSHKEQFSLAHASAPREAIPGQAWDGGLDPTWEGMGRLAQRVGAFPLTAGNALTLYHEGQPALDAMLASMRSAEHHIHLETFILQPDATGQEFLDLLTRKAREGVEVRLLYDAMGSRRLQRRWLQPLRAAGGKCSVFLPLNPFRRHIQVNMRDHRKLLIVDGKVGFAGGLNVGDEYLGRCPRFGFWRDTHLRVEGPAVAGLQRVFLEDWDFAAEEGLRGSHYFPKPQQAGSFALQVIQSGPDQEMKSIREIYFAAILRARRRVWIATPYFVPDAGLLDALCLAGFLGVDVRILCQYHPDKWIPFFAGRYYYANVLDAGVQVYQYTKGMMHAKVMIADDDWASVGSANLDNRSLHLNFEANCLIYSASAVAELEAAFRRDFADAILLDRAVFSRRPLSSRIVENACRLLSPIL
jgi:cardiolipin synthase